MDSEEIEVREVDEIERVDTGIRAVYTLVFFVIGRVVETVLLTVIIFELLYTLVTRLPPPDGVRDFANRALSYFYRLCRYVTYNEADPPFPFAEFPPAVEAPVPVEQIADRVEAPPGAPREEED